MIFQNHTPIEVWERLAQDPHVPTDQPYQAETLRRVTIPFYRFDHDVHSFTRPTDPPFDMWQRPKF